MADSESPGLTVYAAGGSLNRLSVFENLAWSLGTVAMRAVVVVACPVASGATVAALAAAPEAMAATAMVLPATVSGESLRLEVLLLDTMTLLSCTYCARLPPMG